MRTLTAYAQAPPQPYAVIPRDAVNYSGPGRDADHDLPGSEIKVGLLAPLTGPRQDEGRMLLRAAQLAIEDESAIPFPEGRRLSIVPRDQSGAWGRAANEIVHLVYEDQAVALLTPLDGVSAHLAEQVGNKVGIPIVTLSTDPTTTQINLPWIFRLGPTDTQQARAFASDIYVDRKLKRVILITEDDHDGRVGGEEFQKAARALHTAPADRIALDPADSVLDPKIRRIMAEQPEAVVIWTGPERAANLLPRLHKASPSTPVYLCQEAAQARSDTVQQNVWIVTARLAAGPLHANFEEHYRARTGAFPIPAAAQAYDAVRILAAALRRSGPNRARLRDALATLSSYQGASGAVAFDHAGNDVSDFTLTRFSSTAW